MRSLHKQKMNYKNVLLDQRLLLKFAHQKFEMLHFCEKTTGLDFISRTCHNNG
jgi:hypothetical protein